MDIFVVVILAALVGGSHGHIGSCEDHTTDCRKWQSWGFCDTNLQFMALNCPVTCNVCLDPGCFDRNQLCPSWAQRGFCQRNRTAMEVTCPHSCDVCRIPEIFLQPSTDTITNPSFECGKPVSSGPGPSTSLSFRNAPLSSRFSSLSRPFRRSRRQVIFPTEYQECLRQKLVPLANCLAQKLHGGHDPELVRRPATEEPGHHEEEEFGHHDGNTVQGGVSGSLSIDDAFCGATLIHDRFLLTAAHCVLDPDRPVTQVRLGDLDFGATNEPNSRPADYRVKQITVHPEYKPNTLQRYNDVALIETVDTVQFNEAVYPFCISDTRPPPGAVVTGSGFGFVNNTHRATHVQEAEINVIESRECENRFRSAGLIDSVRTLYPQLIHGQDILCAGSPGKDACQGDSGGPLFQEDQLGRRFLVGVISQGIPCRGNGASNLPGFYISTADHIDFINSVIYG